MGQSAPIVDYLVLDGDPRNVCANAACSGTAFTRVHLDTTGRSGRSQLCPMQGNQPLGELLVAAVVEEPVHRVGSFVEDFELDTWV